MLTKPALDRLHRINSGKIQCTKYEKDALTRAALADAEYFDNEFDRDAFIYRYVDGISWERIANILCSTTGHNTACRMRYAMMRTTNNQLIKQHPKTAAAIAAAVG